MPSDERPDSVAELNVSASLRACASLGLVLPLLVPWIVLSNVKAPSEVGQDYYATVAQVIATIVLALVLEVGSIFRRYAPRTRVSERRYGYANGRFLWYLRTIAGPIVLPKPAAVGVLRKSVV